MHFLLLDPISNHTYQVDQRVYSVIMASPPQSRVAVLKRSQPVRGNFTTPSFALPYGGNTSTVKMPVFFSRAMSPSVCSQLPMMTHRPFRSSRDGSTLPRNHRSADRSGCPQQASRSASCTCRFQSRLSVARGRAWRRSWRLPLRRVFCGGRSPRWASLSQYMISISFSRTMR